METTKNIKALPNHIHFIVTLPETTSLHELVRRFKSYTTHKYIEGVKHQGWTPFNRKLWQHNYYEHIIRNTNSYKAIANYIKQNPAKWETDCFYGNDIINNKKN
jgi:REP element-mobilizing transposase RayT